LSAAGPEGLTTALSGGRAFNRKRDFELEDHLAVLSHDEISALPPDGGPEYNRLIFEKSPYLLQHARNPVDWYPWGDEAFERARREDKPIFLSIGYSTCHWCHVMERESFEDPEVAGRMNDAFVCIKVDREERPDIDNVYMSAAQAMTGRGGWPLTVIMAPDHRPFFAATYIPKEDSFGRIGILTLIARIRDLWTQRRSEIMSSADQITSHLRGVVPAGGGPKLGAEVLRRAYEGLAERFDLINGGFGDAPKFPAPHNLLFLLRYWRRTGDAYALDIVERTLECMRRGGIFDHVGLGFHRYSTDEEWLLPHFEKMLYDQAMLAMAYVEAFQATGRPDFATTAREVFRYVMSDMTSPDGAFYSAEDADSDGEEGKYYLWRSKELLDLLGPDEGRLVTHVYCVKESGNFKHETGESTRGMNILHLKKPLREIAEELGTSEEQLKKRLEADRVKLLGARRRRERPLKDDKILADWNGLMIAALAKGAQALGETSYAVAARSAADFLLDRMTGEGGGLLHRYRAGEAAIPAFLDDYAFFIWGLIELYEATFDVSYLQAALGLARDMKARFRDEGDGGFYFCSSESENLIIRTKEIYDGAIPSGNSMAALALFMLGRITGDARLEREAERTIRIFSTDAERVPSAFAQMMIALDLMLGTSFEVVVAGRSGAPDTEDMLRALRSAYVPNKVVVFRPAESQRPPITGIAGYTTAQVAIDGKATAYVCQNYACKAPTTDQREMLKSLGVPPGTSG
jgi:uncharacterized protein YyaL (SSP411 family)